MMYWAETSLYGSFFVLFILAVRKLVKHHGPPGFLTGMWCFAIARFLLPVQVTNVLGLFSLPKAPNSSYTFTTPSYTDLQEVKSTIGSPNLNSPNVEKDLILDLDSIQLVWIIISILLVSVFIALWVYWQLRFFKSTNSQRSAVTEWLNNNNVSRRITVKDYSGSLTPLTYGFLRPVILLPTSIKDKDVPVILMHEYTHIKRGDNFTKCLSILVVCLHWYNPFAWLLFVLLSKDIEIDCDRMTVLKLGYQSNKEYASAILDAIECSTLTVLYPCCSKTDLHERIALIMKTRRTSPKALLLAIVLVLVMSSSLLIGAASPVSTTPVYPQDSGGVVVDGDVEPSVNISQNINEYGFEQLDIAVGKYADAPIRIYNGDMCVFSENGTGWKLSQGDVLELELQMAQVKHYESKGQTAEIGYICNGEMHELTGEEIYKLKQTGKFSFSAPVDGVYNFYLINYCIDSMYLIEASVL